MTTAQVVRQSVEVFSLIYPDHSIVSVLDFWFTCSRVIISLQEFHALKKRCGKQQAEKYICFVAV
jgi:hypothetical protein